MVNPKHLGRHTAKPVQLNCLSMHGVIEHVLNALRPAFSREATFGWFGTYIYALLFNNNLNGVQSMVNAMNLSDSSYPALDGMFRSEGICLSDLRELLLKTIISLTKPLKYAGRCVIIADGVKKPKEGRKMPGVSRMHNNSETQSKPSSYFGIQGGAIGILAQGGSGCCNQKEVYCLPISMELMYGLNPIKDWNDTPHNDADQPLEIQMLNRQKDYIKILGPTLMVQDRASMNQNIFSELETIRKGNVDVYMLTNARGNVTAYTEPGEYQGAGRPRIRGDKVHLSDWFESRQGEFKTTKMWLYGKKQKVHYLQEDLLWGSNWNGKLRFVLAVMEDGRRIILATDDLKAGAKSMIQLYSRRFLCEEGFKVYKNDFAGMDYHFWTAAMEHLSHYRRQDMPHILESAKTEKNREKILSAIKAAEVYMEGACIAQSIALLISMNQPVGGEVQRFTRKRTYTHRKVSERDVCTYLGKNREIYFQKYSDDPLVKFIRVHQEETIVEVYNII